MHTTDHKKHKVSKKRYVPFGSFVRFVVLFAALLFALAPVYWMLTISFKTEGDQFASPPLWFIILRP